MGGPAVNVQFELLSSPCRRPELVWWGRSREPITSTALQTTPGGVQDGPSIGFHGAVHALSYSADAVVEPGSLTAICPGKSDLYPPEVAL